MKQILVATDFSTRSDRALRRAVLTARQVGAELTLVHVVDDDQPNYLIERQKAAAAEILQQTVSTLVDVDQIRAEWLITTGDAFTGILQVAEEADPALIIVGPHRRQFLDTFVGTTAERTIRRSRHPILMVNAVPSGPYRRSLVAVDFDEASEVAINAMSELDISAAGDIIALHLFDAPAIGMMKRAMEVQDAIDHYVSQQEDRARSELTSFLAKCGLDCAQLMLSPLKGSASAAISACAIEQEADLIVLGTNQRKGLERFLLGSVAQGVLLDATQDVLIVPVIAADDLTING